MTSDNHIADNNLGGPPVDKILDHNRLQLSALVDGELSPHEARFLLRRLQHDPAHGSRGVAAGAMRDAIAAFRRRSRSRPKGRWVIRISA